MPITLDEVRRMLDVDEPDYPRIATSVGPEVHAHLAALVGGADPMLASKAAYLAGLVPGPGATQVLEKAASHSEPRVRVAAAASLSRSAIPAAESLVLKLLADKDVGVRKLAVATAAARPSAGLRSRLEAMRTGDPEHHLRRAAGEALLKFGP